MSSSEEETGRVGIDDEKLPEDLQPGEDNPLAEGLDDGETVDDLLEGGKRAEQTDDADAPTNDAASDAASEAASDADRGDDSDTGSGSGES
jgi:hypothetical protein